MNNHFGFLLLSFLIALSTSMPSAASITFEEVAEKAGIVWSGKSGDIAFSIVWLDFNNDELADLLICTHAYDYRFLDFPLLYLNQGSGKFTDNFDRDSLKNRYGDAHGCSSADFDNDGDPDILLSVGADLGYGSQPNVFLINDRGKLKDEAVERGLDYPLGRGRSSLWFDWNHDGLLDVFLTVAIRPDGQAPPAFFIQNREGKFENYTSNVALVLNRDIPFAELADLSGDGKLDLVFKYYLIPSHIKIFLL